MKSFLFAFLILVVGVVLMAGLRGPELRKFSSPPFELFPDMDRQPKYKSQSVSAFFADGRTDRLPVAGTVPHDIPTPGTYFSTGMIGAFWGDGMPAEVKVTREFLARGEERYTINCAVCHGATGAGNGPVSQYGLAGIANLYQDTFVKYPDGQIFHVIGHGKGQMGAYPHISLEDRWAIVAYVRALQRAQNGRVAELPEGLADQLK
jgi:mono/diheme cytochrome c family protein